MRSRPVIKLTDPGTGETIQLPSVLSASYRREIGMIGEISFSFPGTFPDVEFLDGASSVYLHVSLYEDIGTELVLIARGLVMSTELRVGDAPERTLTVHDLGVELTFALAPATHFQAVLLSGAVSSVMGGARNLPAGWQIELHNLADVQVTQDLGTSSSLLDALNALVNLTPNALLVDSTTRKILIGQFNDSAGMIVSPLPHAQVPDLPRVGEGYIVEMSQRVDNAAVLKEITALGGTYTDSSGAVQNVTLAGATPSADFPIEYSGGDYFVVNPIVSFGKAERWQPDTDTVVPVQGGSTEEAAQAAQALYQACVNRLTQYQEPVIEYDVSLIGVSANPLSVYRPGNLLQVNDTRIVDAYGSGPPRRVQWWDVRAALRIAAQTISFQGEAGRQDSLTLTTSDVRPVMSLVDVLDRRSSRASSAALLSYAAKTGIYQHTLLVTDSDTACGVSNGHQVSLLFGASYIGTPTVMYTLSDPVTYSASITALDATGVTFCVERVDAAVWSTGESMTIVMQVSGPT